MRGSMCLLYPKAMVPHRRERTCLCQGASHVAVVVPAARINCCGCQRVAVWRRFGSERGL